jgi:hypothetical protein
VLRQRIKQKIPQEKLIIIAEAIFNSIIRYESTEIEKRNKYIAYK